jgi:hypothetical protein
VILLSQWYEPESPSRRAELLRVRESNENSGLFSRAIYVDGEAKRWTYGEFLEFAAKEAPGETVALANTDIEFNETIHLLDSCPPKRVFALTRWESPSSPRMLGHFAGERFFSGSQDVWVFQAGGVPVPPASASIPLGHVGCENAFLGSMGHAGCEIFNPAIDVRVMHIHADPPEEDRPSVQGWFAYPELTALIGTGLVLCHFWPGSGSEIEARIVQTWQP